jgi:HD domain
LWTVRPVDDGLLLSLVGTSYLRPGTRQDARNVPAAYARPVTDGGAEELCRSLLADELPRRWAHCQGVARQARAIAGRVAGSWTGPVEAAAWLHDIGYASPLADCGFHPLDGARYLRDRGFGDRVLWTLVAHHTCALVEAEERGLGETLSAEFPIGDVDPVAVAALTYCDLTTGPDGQPVDVDERIAEILTRYPPGDVVHRAISRAAPTLRAHVARVRAIVDGVGTTADPR